MGIISPLGNGIEPTRAAIKQSKSGIRPLTLFPTAQSDPLPVGEITAPFETGDVPRTHNLALVAAREAMFSAHCSPDAIVMGVTTGGILTTEENMMGRQTDPQLYAYHSVGSVAEYLADQLDCKGPVITVSTACSSGTVAIKVAVDLLKSGRVKSVLAGGADSLCRLTYYGFNALQLIDPSGAHPFDKSRNGMSVSEGAAMVLLESDTEPTENTIAKVLGVGLSCDAYHPAAPHPEGAGGIAAMRAAIKEARISHSDIDYINLHGTGTFHNDLSEARAINTIFGGAKPPLSSVKGAFGHSLAAAGAIETAVSASCMEGKLIPANTGCGVPDPDLNLDPVLKPSVAELHTVLSNSFGFGGNNAAIILGSTAKDSKPFTPTPTADLAVAGCACLTGSGNADQTLDALSRGQDCRGILPDNQISQKLSPNAVRRLKRLPRMGLSLAMAAYEDSGLSDAPSSIIFGTGWGPLSETYDFLQNLLESNEELTSPTNFVGSVHNSPAGQIAIHFESTGANITTVGDDYSFEQALMTAALLSNGMAVNNTMFVIGADEHHEKLSHLFDRSVAMDTGRSDGGGALCIKKSGADPCPWIRIRTSFFERAESNSQVVSSLVSQLGGEEAMREKYGLVMPGIPLAFRNTGEKQLKDFLSCTGFANPVFDYRKLTGEYASASATAAVLAVRFVQKGMIPEPLGGGKPCRLEGKGALIIGLGRYVTAIEVLP